MRDFRASDLYAPLGDQPRAIDEIAESSRLMETVDLQKLLSMFVTDADRDSKS